MCRRTAPRFSKVEVWEGASLHLEDLARKLDLRFSGDGGLIIRGVASLEDAEASDLCFVRDASHFDDMAKSRAGVVIVPRDCDVPGKAALYSDNPSLDFARAIDLVRPAPAPTPGIEGLLLLGI